MPSLIIFDYDGTLCATHQAISHSLTGVFRERVQIELEPELVSHAIGRGISLHDTLRALHPQGEELVGTELDDWQQHYRAIYHEAAETLVEAFPDAADTIAACREVCPVAIVSNKGPEAIRHSLRQLGMDGLVQHIFGDDGVLPKKPDPALYTGAIQAAFPDARPESTLMVGDTASDLRFAKNAGLRACWAAYGYGGEEECDGVGYEFRIDNLAELPPMVGGL